MPVKKGRVAAPKASIDDRLARLGLRTPRDFVRHLPLRYEDETRLTPIEELRAGETAPVQGRVISVETLYRPRRQLVAQIEDDTGVLALRYLYFYGSQVTMLERARDGGEPIRLVGEVRQAPRSRSAAGAMLEMIHAKPRVVAADAPLPDTLTPVYPASDGISQTLLRKRIGAALDKVSLEELLPESMVERLELIPLDVAVRTIHHPPPAEAARLAIGDHPAWDRIRFDELLAQQISLRRARERRRAMTAPRLPAGALLRRLTAALPFVLTAAQQRVAAQIGHDLAAPVPMMRLLQGDVGSGKTIVAALAAAQCIDAGYQAALMAPTELLSEQHWRKLDALLAPLGIVTVWLTGSQKAAERRAALAAIGSGQAQLIVGTHALFQDAALFHRLGLAIVDEQHRFGVGQRLALRAKTEGIEVHQLMMSATPIPRTLAMSYLADLDVSVIDELPPGRSPIRTLLVDAARRGEVVARIRGAVEAGRQVYWVCPIIEESETLDLQTATDTHRQLTEDLPGISVGLVHGRLPPLEKQSVMNDFAANRIQLLVATTVIEVGVDVPNAALMVIEHSERFGLAQLHQLRGRVGRGVADSVCVLLFAQPLSANARERLRTIHASQDGFEIARRDLELRGPGEFLGARQSGAPLLRFADLERDTGWVEAARDAANELLTHDPDRAEAHLNRWTGARDEFLKA
ncbi:ATP-dependent DNA helicase RecG [soil metagenome]